MQYEIGKTYLIFIPPGWIEAGTVTAADDTEVQFCDAIYIESVNKDSSLAVAAATTPKQLTDLIAKSHPIEDGMIVRRDAILKRVPCQISMRSLARSNEAAAIKRAAKGG